MIQRVARPERALWGIVRSYRLREVSIGSSPRRLVFPARTDQMLEFYLGEAPSVIHSPGGPPLLVPNSVLVGTQALGRVELLLCGRVRTFTIAFTPAGLNQLFNLPMSEFAGKGVEATGVLGFGLQDLRERLGNAPDFERMVAETNAFLRPFGERSASNQDRFLRVVRAIDGGKCSPIGSPDEWVQASGLSHRQFERRFKSSIGVSPKRYSRVRRFQRAMQMKDSNEGLSWSYVAAECGYFDQMHLVHEFRELGGDVPTALIRAVRQRLDFAS